MNYVRYKRINTQPTPDHKNQQFNWNWLNVIKDINRNCIYFEYWNWYDRARGWNGNYIKLPLRIECEWHQKREKKWFHSIFIKINSSADIVVSSITQRVQFIHLM